MLDTSRNFSLIKLIGITIIIGGWCYFFYWFIFNKLPQLLGF